MNRNFTKALSRIVVFLFPLVLLSQDVYQVDPVHSDASFKIRHLLSKTTGTFSKFEGTIIYYPDAIQKSSVVITIKAIVSIQIMNQEITISEEKTFLIFRSIPNSNLSQRK